MTRARTLQARIVCAALAAGIGPLDGSPMTIAAPRHALVPLPHGDLAVVECRVSWVEDEAPVVGMLAVPV